MAAESCYFERMHGYNRLTAWLHSFRYQAVLREVEAFQSKIGERPVRVLDIGCAHARLFPMLNKRNRIDYVGIELSDEFASIAEERFGRYDNFRIVRGSATDKDILMSNNADIVIALESLEHIPENEVVRIIECIAEMKPFLFVCSVPIEIGPAIWLKNVGSFVCGYTRHHEYTWLETFRAGLYQLDKLPPHGIRHKGFDWRWLAQTIRQNFHIRETLRFPISLLPASLSTTVFFVAEPRERQPQER
jgi:SAM-dependent methyltransferase